MSYKKIEELQEENKKLKRRIEHLEDCIKLVKTCLSDYIINDHGIKIVNQKDLQDAEDALKEEIERMKK